MKDELGNFIHFEHINLRVPDHYLATLFFIEGLGLTRDPYRQIGVKNIWANCGKQQFHLPLGEAIPFAGEIGLTVPDSTKTEQALAQIARTLHHTQFTIEKDANSLQIVSPWGHCLRVRGQTEADPLPQAIPYVEFKIKPDTAAGIAAFYRDILGVPARLEQAPVRAVVNVGVNQEFIFAEQADLTLPVHDNHVAVYLTRYQQVYTRLEQRGLLMSPHADEQFRLKKIIDPQSGELLYELEHEMRSLYHPDFLRPLVNRVTVPYLID